MFDAFWVDWECRILKLVIVEDEIYEMCCFHTVKTRRLCM